MSDPFGDPDAEGWEDVSEEEVADEEPARDGTDGPSPSGQGAATAPAPPTGDEALLDDIFGSPDELEHLPEMEGGEGGDEGPKGWRPPGTLTTRFRILTSLYIDIDAPNPDIDPEGRAMGNRWSRDFEGRGTISRQENRLEFFFDYRPNEHISIVGDVEPVFMGFNRTPALADLTLRERVAPFHVESDAAYIGVYDALPGLDVKFGRQIVVWGTADKFNPTNNINSDDLEDRPLFNEPIANQMLVVDFAPWGDVFWMQGVYVPIFYPAQLPPSAADALLDPNTDPPYVDQADRDAIDYLQGYIAARPQFIPQIYGQVERPDFQITNGQGAVKLASRLGPVDLSTSYYYGFFDIPLPVEAASNQIQDLDMAPDEAGCCFRTDVTLIYPRMHVVGLDFATQLPFLDDLGLWGEGGLFIPGDDYRMLTEMPVILDVTPDDGVPNPITEVDGPTVRARNGRAQPFLKVTAGMDYSIGKHVYLQSQYIRGFIDEFGGGNMGNYVMGGGELIFFGRHLVFRCFGLAQVPDARYPTSSGVIAPALLMTPPWGFVTFELGSFALLGKSDTAFGRSATGSSIAYLKASAAF